MSIKKNFFLVVIVLSIYVYEKFVGTCIKDYLINYYVDWNVNIVHIVIKVIRFRQITFLNS